MKRKVLISVLAIFVCLTLVGCGKKDETKGNNNGNNSNNGGNATPAASVAPAEKTISDAAKDAAKNYRIRPEEIGVEFNVIDGYYTAENSNLELRIYVDKEYTKDEKKELHGKVLDYFKSITDDKKVYNLYIDEEFDKADLEASGIWFRGTINGKKLKIYVGGHAPLKYINVDYKDSYRITVSLEK